eukprot:TRINITY_DN211_c0_g2_i10.p2 TRINITY_DN211_c0_g2~~TRINITY_DN211_c0_g2_i10.p2  ORF type:complete len:139 (+),score=32.97 TRINITY_DN211_c0_g2_i10:48-464(+)
MPRFGQRPATKNIALLTEKKKEDEKEPSFSDWVHYVHILHGPSVSATYSFTSWDASHAWWWAMKDLLNQRDVNNCCFKSERDTPESNMPQISLILAVRDHSEERRLCGFTIRFCSVECAKQALQNLNAHAPKSKAAKS